MSKTLDKDRLTEPNFNRPRRQRPSGQETPRPESCAAPEGSSAEVSLFLSLHCPRCGQFANLDENKGAQRCLSADAESHSYVLDGSHHSYPQ